MANQKFAVCECPWCYASCMSVHEVRSAQQYAQQVPAGIKYYELAHTDLLRIDLFKDNEHAQYSDNQLAQATAAGLTSCASCSPTQRARGSTLCGCTRTPPTRTTPSRCRWAHAWVASVHIMLFGRNRD